VNPALSFGGMLDDRKSDIYKMIPDEYLPKTLTINAMSPDVLHQIEAQKLNYPMIVKPDVGYKGFMVRRVESQNELSLLLQKYGDRDVLIQEFLTEPREFALLFYYMPNSRKFGVSSFVEKVLPYVTGDGSSTLCELIEKEGSAFLDKEYVLEKKKAELEHVIAKGEKVIIDHIGNYARGSKFYSRNSEIDGMMVTSAERFFNNLKGINFGRIDMKADSIEAVRQGHFKVLEINGAKAEPLHMYEPTLPWPQVWSAISDHWSILNQIVKEQLQNNFELPSNKAGIDAAYSLKRQTTH